MSDINEVREKAAELAKALNVLSAPEDAATIHALLADHARLRAELAAALSALKDMAAMHLTHLASEDATAATEMVGSHNMLAAAWRLRHTCELPLDQSHAQIMTKLRTALTLAFGEAQEAKAVQP